MKKVNENPEIHPFMLAPCGINCSACYLHFKKNPCLGCWEAEGSKPEHCQICKIKDCLMNETIDFCFECPSFPCEMIEQLEKSYHQKFKNAWQVST
ncbi:MAG: DUF3795 domain-containing protein [Anaerolineales bacterium]